MNGEFRMITDLAVVAPKELLFNYDELKAFLTEALQEYKTLVVTEDSIPEAKSKRAKLNKLADNLDSYRISVKKMLMEQYDSDFAPKVNELKGMTKEASDSISEQIKAFEQREKDAKMSELKAVYDADENTEAKEYCPWESIVNQKWGNKTYSIDDAKEEIRAALFYTAKDLESIRDMGGDDTPYLLDYYKQTRDLNAVVRKILSIQNQREREEKRKLEEEERAKAVAVEKESNSETPADEEPIEVLPHGEPDPVYIVDFRVWATPSQLNSLGAFLKARGIKYGKIK